MEVQFKMKLSLRLGKRDADITRRLKLFQATVTQTALWCSESWTLTAAQKKHLKAVQRNMLRRCAAPCRHPDEDYLTWVRCATKSADQRARDAGCDCWLKQFLRRKFAWAGRVTNMSTERLAYRSTCWRDSSGGVTSPEVLLLTGQDP